MGVRREGRKDRYDSAQRQLHANKDSFFDELCSFRSHVLACPLPRLRARELVTAMAKRQIKDEHGIPWDVWDVNPDDVLGHARYDRRSADRPMSDPAPTDRAVAKSRGLMLHAELEGGLLCFQSGSERRRFAPIPFGWFELPDGVLRVMLDIARPVAASAPPRPRPSPAE
jgi:hypothetical protein